MFLPRSVSHLCSSVDACTEIDIPALRREITFRAFRGRTPPSVMGSGVACKPASATEGAEVDLPGLSSFAVGLHGDFNAVTAGLTTD